MSDDPIKKSDQIRMLQAVAEKTDTGVFPALFTYPNCGWHLVMSGLVTEDVNITTSGRAALFLLGLGADPTDGNSFVEFNLDNPPPAPMQSGSNPVDEQRGDRG